MNCVARKMWGIHDAVRAHKARRYFRFPLTSIPNIPKRMDNVAKQQSPRNIYETGE